MSLKQVVLENEEQRYGRDKSTIVNHAYIESGEYRKKFDLISDDKELNRLLYSIAKRILYHRSGTRYEDMYWIDAETIKVVASITNSMKEQAIKYTANIFKVIRNNNNLITIHSHPSSLPPSYDDLRCNYEYDYQLGVIVCHDGTVYLYSVDEDIPENYYKLAAGDYVSDGYSEPTAFLKVLTDLNNDGKILFKEVTDHDDV